MYKAVVFFDLDGTLLKNDKSISMANADAMHQLEANHVLPVIATGRNIFEIKPLLQKTGINSVVSANGGYVMYENQPLATHPISRSVIRRLNQNAKVDDLAIAYYSNQSDAVTQNNQYVAKNYAMVKQSVPSVNPDWWVTNPVYMMLLFTPQIPNVDQQMEYDADFRNELTFYRNGPYALDTVKYGVSKQTGIKELLADAGLENVPTYAFGDGNNDIPMLEEVDHPVAMANGLPNVRQKAEFVTGTNTGNGIIEGLQHFKLI